MCCFSLCLFFSTLCVCVCLTGNLTSSTGHTDSLVRALRLKHKIKVSCRCFQNDDFQIRLIIIRMRDSPNGICDPCAWYPLGLARLGGLLGRRRRRRRRRHLVPIVPICSFLWHNNTPKIQKVDSLGEEGPCGNTHRQTKLLNFKKWTLWEKKSSCGRSPGRQSLYTIQYNTV